MFQNSKTYYTHHSAHSRNYQPKFRHSNKTQEPNKITEKDKQNCVPVEKDRGQPSSQPKIMVLPVKKNGNKMILILHEPDK